MKLKLKSPLLFVSLLLIAIVATGAAAYYSLNKNSNVLGTRDTPTSASPTPTPPYLPYLAETPKYVGVVAEPPTEKQIVLLREDQSKVVLTFVKEGPIYIVNNENSSNITTTSVNEIALNDHVSVYAKDDQILAIFILR